MLRVRLFRCSTVPAGEKYQPIITAYFRLPGEPHQAVPQKNVFTRSGLPLRPEDVEVGLAGWGAYDPEDGDVLELRDCYYRRSESTWAPVADEDLHVGLRRLGLRVDTMGAAL